jgi:hypothetical protein
MAIQNALSETFNDIQTEVTSVKSDGTDAIVVTSRAAWDHRQEFPEARITLANTYFQSIGTAKLISQCDVIAVEIKQ